MAPIIPTAVTQYCLYCMWPAWPSGKQGGQRGGLGGLGGRNRPFRSRNIRGHQGGGKTEMDCSCQKWLVHVRNGLLFRTGRHRRRDATSLAASTLYHVVLDSPPRLHRARTRDAVRPHTHGLSLTSGVDHQAAYPARLMCRVPGLSRSGYYAWRNREPSMRAQENAALASEILEIHAMSGGTHGAPRVPTSCGWPTSRYALRAARALDSRELARREKPPRSTVHQNGVSPP